MELERHPSLNDRWDPAIRIVDYDLAWRALAQAEIARIRGALGPVAVRVDHVGSTAVPGLAAKPIVDLQVAVDVLDSAQSYRQPLDGLGYTFVPDPNSAAYRLFVRPPKRPRSFHLHVCEAGGHEEHRHLAVRDFLRAHPAEAAGYAALKRELVGRRPNDRLAYIEGKRAHMDALEARALAWAPK